MQAIALLNRPPRPILSRAPSLFSLVFLFCRYKSVDRQPTRSSATTTHRLAPLSSRRAQRSHNHRNSSANRPTNQICFTSKPHRRQIAINGTWNYFSRKLFD